MTEQERRRRPTSEIVSEALLRPFIMLCTEGIMIAFAGFLCLIYGLREFTSGGFVELRRVDRADSVPFSRVVYGFFFA